MRILLKAGKKLNRKKKHIIVHIIGKRSTVCKCSISEIKPNLKTNTVFKTESNISKYTSFIVMFLQF
jgi:hypothetical protein